MITREQCINYQRINIIRAITYAMQTMNVASSIESLRPLIRASVDAAVNSVVTQGFASNENEAALALSQAWEELSNETVDGMVTTRLSEIIVEQMQHQPLPPSQELDNIDEGTLLAELQGSQRR